MDCTNALARNQLSPDLRSNLISICSENGIGEKALSPEMPAYPWEIGFLLSSHLYLHISIAAAMSSSLSELFYLHR